MVKLFIVWSTGERQIEEFNTREEAYRVANGYKMAFGNQVWVGID